VLNTVLLDDLLANEEPHATFHDAAFEGIEVDYVARRLVAHVRLCVGNPDDPDASARERRRVGTLTVEGVVLWALEPGIVSGNYLWLTSDGPLNECSTEAGKTFAAQCRACSIAWFMFFSDLNAFGYVAGSKATFTWV
jgi:hypothetical protein